MSNQSYIASNPEELFDQAPPEIQELIHGDAVNNVTAILGKTYKIPVSSYVALSNLITFILIGAILPEDAVRAIIDILSMSEEEARKLATDLDKTILEKARISILGKSPKDMVTLSFEEGRTPTELRKEILDTTKRESAFSVQQTTLSEAPVSIPSSEATTKQTILAGSRSQLMEQLQILDAIPDDEEISERLQKIQAQIADMDKKNEQALDSMIVPQEFMPKNKDIATVIPETQSATYSKAPTKYNVDPYREVSEES